MGVGHPPLFGKIAIIGLWTLLLFVALGLVDGLIGDRQVARQAAEARLAEGYGGPQFIAAPLLGLTVTGAEPAAAGEARTWKRTHWLLADELKLSGTMTTELRYSGIYEVPSFRAELRLTGRFAARDVAEIAGRGEHVDWQRVRLVLPVDDTAGLHELGELDWQGQSYALAPSGSAYGGVETIAAVSPPESGSDLQFSLRLTVGGTGALQMLPLARHYEAELSGDWPHPSFAGRTLPVSRTVTDEEFTARWRMPELRRPFPQHWIDFAVTPADWRQGAFGVELFLPVDLYQRLERAIKYGLLFVSLSFMSLFAFEHAVGLRIHPIQYLMVGLALALFYLLLLALAEHIGFAPAYVLAAGALVALIGHYLAAAIGRRDGWLGAAILAAVYAVLYLITVAERFALLMGALSLLATLSVLMLATRRVDWYALEIKRKD